MKLWQFFTKRFNPTIRKKWLLGLVCLWVASGLFGAEDRSGNVSEYQLKAAFVYNFTQFTEWPAKTFEQPSTPIIIGIVGEDPFGTALDEVVKGEVIRGRPLVIQRFRVGEDLSRCQILFISRSEKDRVNALLAQLKGRPVLTVSDIKDFAQDGGMVNLILANKAVKLEVNQAVAEKASLQLSAKLLKLARITHSR